MSFSFSVTLLMIYGLASTETDLVVRSNETIMTFLNIERRRPHSPHMLG